MIRNANGQTGCRSTAIRQNYARNQPVELSQQETLVKPAWQPRNSIDYERAQTSTSSKPGSHSSSAISSRSRPVSVVSPLVVLGAEATSSRTPSHHSLRSIANLASRSRTPIVISSYESDFLPQRLVWTTISANSSQSLEMSGTDSLGNLANDQRCPQLLLGTQPSVIERRTITTNNRTNLIDALTSSRSTGALPDLTLPTSAGAPSTQTAVATRRRESDWGADHSLRAAYERRRSIYESIPRSQTIDSSESLPVADLSPRDNLSSPLLSPRPSLVSVRDLEGARRQQRPSDSSLDNILADIESGRPAFGEPPTQAGVKSPGAAPIEMHEFSQPMSAVELNGQASIATSPTFTSLQGSPDLRARRQVSTSLSDVSSDTGRSATGHSSLSSDDKLTSGASSRRRRSRDVGARRKELVSGFEIAWLDFTYSVEPNILEDPRWGRLNKIFHKERRTILKGLSGGFKSGQMVALMGPSGAGKTCLLESISGVRTSGIGGRMCLRGRKRAQLVIVPQYDDFMPQFSVEETIVYGSRMKNPAGTNHRKVADTVIEQLGLQVCRHNNIQRCSGGQRKRVAIAQELVSRPNILILDEPTSGLDSSCCYQTMRVLRDVLDQSVQTEEPMVIVSTIHQPSAKVFKMFDLVYLLGKTGYMAYSGPPDELLPTISDVTGLECPTYSNPSDFMIELVAYDYGKEPVERLIEFERQKAAQYKRDFEKRAGLSLSSSSSSRSTAQRPPTHGKQQVNDEGGSSSTSVGATRRCSLSPSKSDTHLAMNSSRLDQIQRRLKATDLLSGASHVIYQNNVTVPLRKATSTDQRRHPFLWHTWTHCHRSYLQAIRDPILNNMRILIHLGFATLLVLLYGKKSGEARGCPPVLGLPAEITDPNNESMIDLADNVGYLFMCIMMITYVSLMSTVLTFPIDIKTVGKEHKNGWYGTLTYFLGKTIADLPFIVAYPVVYCLITWFLTNQAQDHAWRYFYFSALIIMNAMNSQSFGLILGALFVNSVTAATFLGPVITIPWYLFTGFTKRTHRLAEPFKTTSKFLFTRYIFEGILDTVYGNQRCNCSAFLQEYYELRDEEASRLGQLVSVETLSSLDYYDDLETVARDSIFNETLFPMTDGNGQGSLGALGGGGGPSTASKWLERTVDAASTVFADSDSLNLASLMDTNVKASSMFSFGLDFEPTCPSDYNTYVVQDFRLGERNVEKAFVIVLCMLCVIRVITFLLVSWKIKTRQL